MGAVYEAIDRRLSSIVAVKETFAMTEEGRAAFLREAKILANLDHEAFPKVSDYFEEGEGLYLVMQLVRGNDLEELLKLRESPFSTVKVLEWADQLLDALEDLHKYKPPIIHRDVKPSNLKLTKRGKIILLDFGIAKGAAGQMSTLRTDGSLGAATPHFAPLEQILRVDPSSVRTLSTINREWVEKALHTGTDPRSDLYSLGATIYYLMTCELPDDARLRAMAVWSGKPDPLQPADKVNPQVPSAVSAILMQAMSLDRSERPPDATTMRRALREAVQAPVVTPPTIPPHEELIRQRKEEEERQRARAEAERQRREEEERQRREAEEAARRLAAEQEAARLAEEERARVAAEAEQTRKRAEENRRKRREEQERQRAEEEKQHKAEADETRRKQAVEGKTDEETIDRRGTEQSAGASIAGIPTLPAASPQVIYSKPEETITPTDPTQPAPSPRLYRRLYVTLAVTIMIASLLVIFFMFMGIPDKTTQQPGNAQPSNSPALTVDSNSTPVQPAPPPTGEDITLGDNSNSSNRNANIGNNGAPSRSTPSRNGKVTNTNNTQGNTRKTMNATDREYNRILNTN